MAGTNYTTAGAAEYHLPTAKDNHGPRRPLNTEPVPS